MTRDLAERIIQLHIEHQKIINEQYTIMREQNLYSWDAVSAEAMKFLIGDTHAKE